MATPTIPRNADELEEMLGDAASAKEIVKSPKALTEFIVDFAKGQMAKAPEIEQQIRDQVDRGIAEALRNDRQVEQIHRLNFDPNGAPVRNKHYNPKAPGAKLDTRFSNWGEFLGSTWDGNRSQESYAAQADIKQIQNSFGSTVPGDGGFLIPEQLRAELLRVSLESAVVRSRARTVPMETLSVPYPMIDSTSNASSVYGGITGYWTEEGGSLTDSSPTFGRINLIAKKLTLYSEIPNELFQDSIISLQQFMSETYPEALAWFEDVAFTTGNGAGQPLGYLNAPAAVTVAKETGQAAGSIVWENIVKMYARMLPSSMNRAVWVCHVDTFPELATMALSVGTGGSAVWVGNLSQPGADAPPMSILGRPVVFTEKVSSVGTVGDINLVDFGYYLIGDRQVMQSSTSAEYKFANDKTAMRVIERVDGQPWIQSAITPNQGSNTLSPFVKLATRS
ncbi:phage major capsid protein [Streptomyces sp. NPDC020490]|uniref:phage major capsid protein n=1 Tax=Streptomyces sp. NPDC020490 TaxID=3365078 RepID=UPI00378CE0EE